MAKNETDAEKLSTAARFGSIQIRLLGMIAVKGLPQTQQIALLSRAGLTPKEIAELLGTTSNTVRVALVAIRRDAKTAKNILKQNGREKSHEEAKL